MQLQNQLFNYFDHTSLIFCLFHSQWTHVGVTHNTHTHELTLHLTVLKLLQSALFY